MRLKIVISTAILSVVTACGPQGVQQGFSVKEEPPVVTSTYEPERPTIYREKENSQGVVNGATKNRGLLISFDKENKNMFLIGKMDLTPVDGSSKLEVPVHLFGPLNQKKSFVMREMKNGVPTLPQGVRIGAKATCLEESCRSSFVDIYIAHKDKIYHHQVEISAAKVALPEASPTEEAPNNQNPSSAGPSNSQATPADSETEHGDTEGESEEEEPIQQGHYVGNILEDVAEVFAEPKSDSEGKDKDKDKPAKEKGTHRPSDQAVGSVNKGRLEGGIDMLATAKKLNPAGFQVIRPERKAYYATTELAYIIKLMGDFTKKSVPDNVITVGDLSRASGGKLGRHFSHQTGLDADVAFYFNNKTFQGKFTVAVAIDKPHANWMGKEQWALFKALVDTKYIDRIFIHSVLKKELCKMAIQAGEIKEGQVEGLAFETLRRLRPDKDHHNHFHLRVKCSKDQPRCRQMAEPVKSSGCF